MGKSVPNFLTGELKSKLIPIKVVMDERICTGHDYAVFYKTMRRFLKNFSQNSVKNALCGVVGSEKTFKRVWDSSQQAKSVRQAIAQMGRFTEMGTRFLCLLRNLSL